MGQQHLFFTGLDQFLLAIGQQASAKSSPEWAPQFLSKESCGLSTDTQQNSHRQKHTPLLLMLKFWSNGVLFFVGEVGLLERTGDHCVWSFVFCHNFRVCQIREPQICAISLAKGNYLCLCLDRTNRFRIHSHCVAHGAETFMYLSLIKCGVIFAFVCRNRVLWLGIVILCDPIQTFVQTDTIFSSCQISKNYCLNDL